MEGTGLLGHYLTTENYVITTFTAEHYLYPSCASLIQSPRSHTTYLIIIVLLYYHLLCCLPSCLFIRVFLLTPSKLFFSPPHIPHVQLLSFFLTTNHPNNNWWAQSIPVAAQSKAWVYCRSHAGIAGSNPGCLSLVSVLCYQVEVFATGTSLVQRIPSVYVYVCVCVCPWAWSGATITRCTYSRQVEDFSLRK